MATTFVEYTGDGNATKQFTFPSYQESDVKVRVDGVLKTTSTHYNITNYTTTGGGNVVFTSGNIPSSPAKIRIYRDTSVDAAKATYTAGASVKAADLNNNNTQLLYRAQEEQVPNLIQTYDINDDAITASKIDDGTIVTGNLANSSVTQNKLANNSVGTPELINGSVNSDKILDGTIVNADVNASAAIAGTKINPDFGSQNLVTLGTAVTGSLGVLGDLEVDGDIDFVGNNRTVDGRDVSVDGAKLDTIETNAKDDQTAAEIKTLLQSNKLTANEIATGALDGRYFTEAESDARYFNISSGETIKDGDTFPDNDTTIATTAAINDRIIDLIDDVGGFDIIQSEQHFPNTNPQGTTGQAAVLSVKAATTNLVPSGTTVTISNGNLANNANITITGVTSTIPTGFGFLVESTSTTHTYAFHRLVPKATEVTTIASNISNINAAANNESNINAAVSNASNINAAVSNASNINAAVSNASNINAAVSNASNINSAVSNASNITTTASNIANVNNVGTNIAKVNSVAAVLGGTQTFTVTVSGGVFYIDGQSKPVLTLARGFTYTFNQADSSNSGHPLAFRDSSDNAYTTGVTVNGTAGSSGATVVFAVPSNAPSSLKYYCTVHGNGMGNTITVTDDNIGTVAGSIANVNTTAGSIANVNTTAGSISNVNTVASNISSVNSFFNTYRIGANNPTTSLDVGDLFFNTTSNSLKVYTGSAWVDGVTATGNFAVVTGNTFTGSNRYNDNVKAEFGTGADLQIYHDATNSYITNVTGDLNILNTGSNSDDIFIKSADNIFFHVHGTETGINITGDGSVDLFFDGSKKFETHSAGVKVSAGNLYLDRDNAKAIFGAGDDLQIYHNGSNSYIDDAGTGSLIARTNQFLVRNIANDNNIIVATAGGSVDLYHNNSRKLHTRSDAVNIIGDLDMTDADSYKINLGASSDLQIYHDGSTSYVSNTTDTGLLIRNLGNGDIKIKPQNSYPVELYYNGAKRFETTSYGAGITSSGSSHGLKIFHSNGNEVASLTHGGSGDEGVLVLKDSAASTVVLRGENGTDVDITTGGNFDLEHDSAKLRIGASNDLQIYHDGSNSYVSDTNTGNLKLTSNGTAVQIEKSDGENMAIFRTDGAVELFHDNNKKLETQSWGTSFTGNVSPSADNQYDLGASGAQWNDLYIGNNIYLPDAGEVRLGNSGDLQLYHDGSNSYINDTGTGSLILVSNAFKVKNSASNEAMIYANENGAVELYHNNSKKFETASYGVSTDGLMNFNGTGGKILLADNGKIEFGGHTDMQIYHYNGDNYINIQYDAELRLTHGSDYMFRAIAEGANRLYYDNSTKAQTTSTGFMVNGQLDLVDNNSIRLGSSQDARLYHSGSSFHLFNQTGNLHLNSNSILIKNYDNDESFIRCSDDAEVKIYYDNSEKLRTASTGVHLPIGRITLANDNSWYGEIAGSIQHHSNYLYFIVGSNGGMFRSSGGTDRLLLDSSGNLIPAQNNSYDLGSSSKRWKNIYTQDLQLSNEATGDNGIDGTWGNYTIVEGESDLFLKNNRSGKTYKFNLTEVS